MIKPTLLELSFIPAAALHPGAVRELRGLRSDGAADVFDALDGRKTDVEHEEPLHAAAMKVRVRVEQAWRHGTPIEIDPLGGRADVPPNLVVAADGENLAAGDSHGLRDAIGGIDRDDLAVQQNHIRGDGRLSGIHRQGTSSQRTERTQEPWKRAHGHDGDRLIVH